MTLILRAEVGSRAYGTHTEFSDRDMAEVVIEPPEYVTGLSTWDTRMVQTAGEGNRSTKDDTDTTIYGLNKFCSLAAAGNPSVLSILFLGDDSYEVLEPAAQTLIKYRDMFVSKEAGKRHLGYMVSQRMAITGARNKRTNRPELVAQHSWDTKFGMHMIRLGYMGLELMETGGVELPLRPEVRDICLAIREGKVSKEDGLALSFELEAKLEEAILNTDLPEKSNRDNISAVMHSLYTNAWASK